MRIDLTQVFEGRDGKPITDSSDPSKSLTLGELLITAVLNAPAAEGEKMKRYDLYRKLRKARPIESFRMEELVDLKKASLAVCTVLTVGQVHAMLDKDEPEEPPLKDEPPGRYQ